MIDKNYLKTLKQTEIMALLDLSERRIQQLHGEGLPRNGSGRGITYDWAAVDAWRTRRTTGSGEGAEATGKARKEAADADLAEMKRDAMAGTLLEAEDVRRGLADMVARMRAKLLTLPAKVAVRIEEGQPLAVREDFIQEVIYEALAELVIQEGDENA